MIESLRSQPGLYSESESESESEHDDDCESESEHEHEHESQGQSAKRTCPSATNGALRSGLVRASRACAPRARGTHRSLMARL
jgi:hypothetical protein